MSVMSDLLENNTPSESPYYEGGGTPGRGDPGFFGSILNNVASGFESVVGGGLDYIGANLNRLDEDGRASSYVESIRNGGKTGLGKLGDWLINNGEYLNNDAARRNQNSGTLDKYQDETVLQRLTDLGYLTDSRGLLADVSNMGGSAVPFAAASMVVPGGGLGAKAARGAGGLFERAGMGTLGRAVASEEGQSAAGAAARWALGGGTLEPVTNAGSMYSDLKSQGLSDNEIARHMNSAAYEELPIDMLTQGVLGPILEGKALAPLAKTGGRIRRGAIRGLNIPGAASSEYVQEMTQQQVQNKWTGQPYGTLLNPTEDEQQAGRAAFMGTLPLGLFGAARGAFRKRRGSTSDMRDNSAMNSAVTSQQDNIAADRSNDPTNPFAGQPKVLGSAPSIQTEQVLSSSQMPSGDAGKEAFFNAISGQESGGDYNAENGNSGAFGKYQIMPNNWPSWAEEAGIGSDAEQTPENQETVAKFKLGQLYDTYGPEGAMVAWYAGDANAQRYVNGDSTDIWGRAWNEPQSNGPSIQSYVDDVMGKIGSAPQQNQSSSVPTYDLPTQGDSITEQITHLKPDFQQALPIIGGMLNQAGLAEGAQISSAARTPEHNAEVGGVENSYHIDHGDGGDAVDIVLPDGTTDQQAQAVLQMFKDTGAFQEVLFHDVGSGYHLHLGGYNGGLDGSNAASNAAKAAPPKLDLSKLDLTPEQQAQNQAAAEALVSSGQVSPEQQAAVMQMAQSMVMVPTDNSAEKDIARANVLQQAVDNNDLKTVYNMLPQQTVQAVASTRAPNNRTNITASGAPTASRISVDQLDPKKFSPVDRVSYALNNGDYVGAAKVAESIGDNNTAKLFLRAVNNPDVADQIQNQLQKGLNFSSPDQIQSNAMIQQNDTTQNTMSNPSDVAPVAVDDQQQGNTPIQTPVQFKPVTPAQTETQQYQPNKQVKVVAQQPSRENGDLSIPESTVAQAAALSDNTDRIADRMNELNTMSTNDRVSLGKKLLKQMVTDGESMGETFKDELSRGGRKAIAKAEERIERSKNNESTQTTSDKGGNTEDNDKGIKSQAGDVRQSERTSKEGKVNTAERAQKSVQNVEDPKHEEIHATDKETDHTERGSKSTDEQEQNSKKGNNTNKQKAAEAFGTSEGKKEQLADMLGLKPKKKAKVMNIVDDSDEALEVYFKEAQHKMKQVHSGIDPTLLVPLFKIGMVYVQRGVNRFADFADKVVDRLGDKARPWLRAAWETVQAYPKDLVFNEKHMNAVFTYVGARIGEGASLEEIKSDFVDAYGQEETKPFMPMFDCAYKGVQTFLNEKGDSSNVDDSTGKLAERTGGRTNKDTVGADDGRGKPSGRSKSEGLQSAGTKAGTQGSVRVRDRSAVAGREVGDSGVQKEESSNRTGSTGSSELSGSVRDSYEGSLGLDDGRKAADIRPVENRRVDEGPVKQNKGTDKAGNLESIKNDLPMLLPAQQEDVAFAERRLDENGAQGVMFTNGTGTGKTFTGLGVIKRMVLQGKKNILVVSPTAEINKQWIDTAKEFFGLNLSPLESITDIGKHGVCITTYANFQSNKELVKRNWDAVVADESHNLMNNKSGEDTGYIKMLRVLTMHPREAINRFKMLHRTKAIIQYEKANDELSKQISSLKKQAKASHGDVMTATNITAKEKELRDKISDNTQAIYDIYASMAPERKAFEKQMQEMPADARPKAIFLSATPFAYDKDVDYAEGYLFNYDTDNNSGRYNHADGRDKFMIQNFGYRMRYNKLTRPEAEVDNRVMEVSFHDKLVDSGAMSGRQIDVDKDYDRGFLLVDGGIGKTIDDGFTWLRDSKKYRELSDVLFNQFKNRERKYLLESIKAKAAIPFIQKYAQSGKKVVLFHQAMVEKRNVHPFKLKSMFSTQSDDERMRIMRQYESFKHERPDLIKLNLNALPSPMETLKNELGKHAVYVDGQTSKKDRAAAIKLFNSDKSGMNVIVVQQDAGNAGISLHDTTGKHPRVLINIAMPERPSYAMQIEGRIFRVGNASNATFRYLATGMNIEKEMFANTIGGRAATVENLAVGDEARGLHESFTDAYMETMDGTWKRRLPGHPDEGTGGKEKDMAQRDALSEYDRAKSFYFANQKKTSATKAAEGNDYFATPEPIGYKMVEWLGLKAGDRALEPSAGHGAISRWFNPNTQNTIVEPSAQLAPLAQMVTPESRVIHSRFEDFNIINKFDGIAMNPPFGSGGKTAVEHIAKAYRQLADGGRMVAIMPDGPAANKHFNKWFYGTDDVNGEEIDAAPKGAVLTATIRMPGVMFGRAGTGVATKILVIDKHMDTWTREIAEQEAGIDIDLHDVTRINDLFDRVENMTMPERIANHSRTENVESATDKILDEGVAAGEKEGSSLGSNFIVDNYEHTKTHEMIPSAKLKDRIDNFNSLKSLAKKNGGYYSRYAKSFLFDDAVKRDQFIKEADALIGPGMLSTEGSAEDMLSKITFPDESTLSSREQNIADFGKSLGVPVVFFDGPSQLHGFHRHNITFLNRRSATSLSWTFWHETFHWLRNNNPRLYQQMVDYVRGKEAFNPEQLKAYRDDIGRPELSDAETIEEMLADTMPEVKKRVSFMKDLGKDDPSLAQSIVAWIRNIMDRFRDALCRPGVGLTPTQSEAMRNAFANLAADMVDSDGRRIFNVSGKERVIRVINSGALANMQLSLNNSGDVLLNNTGKKKLELDVKRWNELCDMYEQSNKETWKTKRNGKLYKFMDMPLVLEMISNNAMHLSVYGSFFAHAIRDIHQGMDMDVVRQLPASMPDPSMIFKDKGKFIFVLQAEDKNGVKIVVPVELNKVDNRHGVINVVNTAYGKTKSDGVSQNENWIINHIDQGHLVYVNKEKALFPGHHELTLRVESAINSALSKSSIKTGADLVNKRLDDPTKYSVIMEPAGVPKRIYHALMDLVGLGDTKLESNIEQRKAKGDKEKSLDNLNVVDMWAKSVRQVARKNEAVKFFYGLGRKAYSEQEHLRNEYAQAMRRFNAYTKNEQDNKDVSSVLWQGDAEGRDFTVKELKAMGLSDNAIRAYHVVRDNLKKAYNMVNDARMQVKVRSRTMSRNDIDDFKVAHFLSNSDILKVTPREDGRVLVTYRGAKVHEVTGAVVSEDAFKGMKGDRDIVVTNEIQIPGTDGENLYKVNYTERIKPLVNRTGYMPHFFHKFMVYEKYTGEDGKEKLVSLGSGESLKKAAALANKYAKEMSDREYVIRPHGFESDEEYNNVVVGDTNYTRMTKQIADHTEMTLSQANQFLHDSAGVSLKGRHRFFGNMQKRTGAEGWDKDMSWALAHYFNAASRYVAMEHFKPDAISMYERLFGDFNAVQRNNTAKYIKKFISDMNGNPQWIEEQLNKALEHTTLGRNLADYYNGRPALALSGNVSSFNAVTKLGLGNFASAAINFMQFINVATRLNSYKYAMRGLNAALKPNELDNKIVDASGVMDEVNLSSDAGGYTQHRDYGKARKGLAKIKQAADFSMRPFTWADTLMRKAAVIGGYYQGVEEKGMKPEDGDELSKAALNYANDVNFDANFDYSAVSTPGAIRAGSVLTQQMFQFQKYPIMQFEFLWNNVIKADNNAQRARFLVPYLLLAGAVGSIPFGDLMNQFLSFVFGLFTGKDENLADDVKAELMKWAGNDSSKRALVNTVLYGVLANIGVDVSSRVGMSNSFSGEFYGNKPEGAAGMITSVMGGPLVSTIVNVIHQAHEHNPIEAIKAISPALGNIMQAMAGETRTTHHRVGSVYTTAYDRIIHGLGFRSTDETNNSFVNSYLYDSRKKQAEDKKDAMDEYIRNPSEINRRNLNDFGITDKTFKKYKEDSEKSAKERGQQEKKVSKNSKSKKPDTEGQRNDRELKAFTK